MINTITVYISSFHSFYLALSPLFPLSLLLEAEDNVMFTKFLFFILCLIKAKEIYTDPYIGYSVNSNRFGF